MFRTTTARRLINFTGAATAALALAIAPAASATGDASSGTDGLYGSADPTFDGVFRQSLALIALTSAGREPSPVAVRWLTAQQCANGGWMSFRPDTGRPCEEAKQDTNATAMAVQALVAVGEQDARRAADEGLAWLRDVRNADGGVGYNPGSPTDANSTALLVNAAHAGGVDPRRLRTPAGNTPLDALLDLQIGCDAPEEQRGAFAYQPDKSGALLANDSATVAAVLALAGGHLPVTEPTMTQAAPAPECPAGGSASTMSVTGAVGSATTYLAHRIEGNDGTIPPMQGKVPDYFTTANAVIALSAAGQQKAAAVPTRALAGNVDAYVPDPKGADQPAALASLVLAAKATGENPADFGGEDVVDRLVATGPPAPRVEEAAADAAGGSKEEQEALTGAGTLMTVGGLLAAAAAVAVAFGLSRRRGGRP